jgi:hypothetical protein
MRGKAKEVRATLDTTIERGKRFISMFLLWYLVS